MSDAFHTVRGALLVLLMVLRTRGGTRSEYWTWRESTAFGDQGSVTKPHRLQAIREYCRWVSRTRGISC